MISLPAISRQLSLDDLQPTAFVGSVQSLHDLQFIPPVADHPGRDLLVSTVGRGWSRLGRSHGDGDQLNRPRLRKAAPAPATSNVQVTDMHGVDPGCGQQRGRTARQSPCQSGNGASSSFMIPREFDDAVI